MVDFQGLLQRIAEVSLYLCIGFAGRRVRFFNEETNRVISKLIMYLFLPFFLVSSFVHAEYTMGIREMLRIILFATLWQISMLLLARGVASVLSKDQYERGNYSFLLGFGNIGIFGLPLIQPLFGSAGMMVGMLFNVPFNALSCSVGLCLIRGGKRPEKLWKMVFSAPFAGVLIGMLLFLLKIHLPAFAKNAVMQIGTMCLPMMMISVGVTLADARWKEILSNSKTLLVVLIKLLVFPCFIWAAMLFITKDPILRGVSVALTAMPCAGLATTMNILYGRHEKEASAAVFLSTIMSLITVPFITWHLLM